MKARTAIWRTGLALLAGGMLFPALANPSLLPADTVFALGLSGIDQHMEKFQPLADEWNRLGLTESLGTLFASTSDELEEIPAELEEYQDVDPLELLGRSAWLGVSLSAGNPIPTVTVLLEPTGAALATVRDSLASLESEPETTSLTEGEFTFLVVNVEEEATEGFVSSVAVSLAGDRFVFSSNPDALRGVLRRLAGSDEPSLAGASGFASAAELTDGNLFSFIDMPSVVRTASTFASPFAAEFGVSALLDEAVSALSTVGVIASSTTFTADGMSSNSLQVVGDSSATVRNLLLNREAASRDALGFVSEGALGVASGFSNPTGWWDYLNTLLAKYPELGIGSLDELFLAFGGIDIRAGFFNWVGSEMTTVTTGLTTAAAPGVASENLLGQNLYILRTSADADAQAGLDNIVNTMSMLISSFTSLDGSSAAPAELGTTELVEGVSVRTLDVTDGVTLSYAVTDGFVLVATDGTSVAEALQARAAGGSPSETIARMLEQVPAGAVSYSVADTGASLRGLAGQVSAQIETVAGLSGEGVDFEALDAASNGLEEFLNFVADRTGGSWSHTQISDGVIRSQGFSEVDW